MIKVLLVIVLLTSCVKSNLETKLIKKSWSVEEVEYDDSLYKLFFFANNTMNFKEDGSCKLPYFEYTFGLNSSWKLTMINNEEFRLSLYNSQGNFLDGDYEGVIVDSAYYKVMTLKNSKLKLVCKSEL